MRMAPNGPAALARGFFPIDHGEDRRGEIGRGVHQPVRAGGLKLVSATIAPEHAKTAHSDRMGTGNIVSPIPDHQAARRRKTMLGQNMGEQFGLVIERAARHCAVNAIEIRGKLQMVEDAPCKDLPLRCREINSQPGLLHRLEGLANSRIGQTSEIAGLAVMLTIGGDCLTHSVVAVWPQQDLHQIFERRADAAPYIEGFIRLMSKGAKRRHAACQNAGERIDQGTIEVQKNGASHDPKITVEPKRVHVRLVPFPLRVIRYRTEPAARAIEPVLSRACIRARPRRRHRLRGLDRGRPPAPGFPRAVWSSPPASMEAETPKSGKSSGTLKPGVKRGRARQASAPSSRDGVTVMGVAISNPDKALWPDAGDGKPVTKLDLARYYEAVGAWMIPHIKGRPCSILRAPDGIADEQFLQRHAMPGMSKLWALTKVAGDKKPYLRIDRVEGLAAAAQTGGLELHPWNSAPGTPDIPGRLIFDLDPAPDLAFAAVIEAALELRGRIEGLGLVAFCKTTGGKGLHVVTPLAASAKARATWPEAKAFALEVCRRMAADNPDRYLLAMAKDKRGGHIFLDYLRNDRTATAVAPLSPRARAGATVSMPLTWAQVGPGLDPKRFTIRTTPAEIGRA